MFSFPFITGLLEMPLSADDRNIAVHLEDSPLHIFIQVHPMFAHGLL